MPVAKDEEEGLKKKRERVILILHLKRILRKEKNRLARLFSPSLFCFCAPWESKRNMQKWRRIVLTKLARIPLFFPGEACSKSILDLFFFIVFCKSKKKRKKKQ